jgi:hypothetical protein
MHLVVNHLRFREPVDPNLFSEVEASLGDAMRAIPGFRGVQVVQATEDHVILLIGGDSAEAVDRVATEVGSPWMLAHVVPLLVAPPERHVGPVVATVTGAAV